MKFLKLVSVMFFCFAFSSVQAFSDDTVFSVVGGGLNQPAEKSNASDIQINSYTHRVDANGNIYFTDTGVLPYESGFIRVNKHSIVDRFFKSDLFNTPWLLDDMAVDSAGNVFLAANAQCKIYKITPKDEITVYAGNGTCGESGDNGLATEASIQNVETIAIDGNDNIYAGTQHSIRKIDNNTGIITTIYNDAGSSFNLDSLYSDNLGNVYFYNNQYKILKIDKNGLVSDFAGDGASGPEYENIPATSSHIGNVHGITGDQWGNIYFEDEQGWGIRKVDTSGIITKAIDLSTLPPEMYFARISTDRDGMVYVSEYQTLGTQIFKKRFAPILSSLSATTAPVGSTVTLSGRYFGSQGDNGQVKFNGISATIVFWSNETIVCTVPQGATNGDVIVIAPPENQPVNWQSNGINFRPK